MPVLGEEEAPIRQRGSARHEYPLGYNTCGIKQIHYSPYCRGPNCQYEGCIGPSFQPSGPPFVSKPQSGSRSIRKFLHNRIWNARWITSNNFYASGLRVLMCVVVRGYAVYDFSCGGQPCAGSIFVSCGIRHEPPRVQTLRSTCVAR